jgi:hypothetical protein
VDPQWLWKGRHVYLFYGTTVTMPDTPENQEAYPQVYNQQPGVGFPIARLGAIISLACGAIVNLGVCRYAGKGQGEVSLVRRLWDILRPGDVLLIDALMANWTTIVMLKEVLGVDVQLNSDIDGAQYDFFSEGEPGARQTGWHYLMYTRTPVGVCRSPSRMPKRN